VGVGLAGGVEIGGGDVGGGSVLCGEDDGFGLVEWAGAVVPVSGGTPAVGPVVLSETLPLVLGWARADGVVPGGEEPLGCGLGVGVCSNGGALSSIGVSWVVLDSVMTHNRAIGWGANPARSGTPGGGSGGAIYTDGDTYTVTISGSTIADNHAREGGGAVFYVSDDLTGSLRIEHSTLRHNPNDGFFTAGYPGIFFLGLGGHPIVTDSVIR